MELSRYPIVAPESYQHKYDNLTIAAGGIIFAHNQVLLNRSDTTDLWSIPGGSISTEISIEHSVCSTIKSELNLKVSVIDTPPFIYHLQTQTSTGTDLIILFHFLVKIDGSGNIVMGANVSDYEWFGFGHHFRDCYPNVKPAVDHYLQL